MPSAGRAYAGRDPSAAGVIPDSSLILAVLAGGPRGDHGRDVLAAVGQLASCHQRQWAAEDACRAPGAPAEEVARVKRRIDELNATRTSLVERIDVWVEGEVRRSANGLLHTETLGSVIDRLAIAWVRAGNLEAAGGRPFRARLARRQLAELAEAYDALVCEVTAGRRRLPAWRPLKTYATENP